MRQSTSRILIFTFGLALVAAWAAPLALAGEGGHHEVRVHKVVKCDDGDCTGEHHGQKVLFVGEDGTVQQVPGGFSWVGVGEDGKGFTFDFAGKGGYLGVMLSELTPELRRHFGVSEEAGVMVSRVLDDTPAARAGVEVGDIITAVNGEAVASAGELAARVRRHEAGETVALEVRRDGRLENLAVTVEERELPGGFGHLPRQVFVHCEEGEDCGAHALAFDCGEERCEVRVECSDGECSCTVNGEPRDCGELPGIHTEHD